MFGKTRGLWWLLCLVLLLVPQLGYAQPPSRPRHVVIVSIDGAKPSVVQRAKMEALNYWIGRGAHTWEAFTVVPSVTLVSHTSMLTGVQPDKHLVDWNDWKPDKGLVKWPTIFALAKAKGLTTALFAGKEKFKHLNVPGTLDAFAVPEYKALTVAQEAAQCLTRLKPNLCFIHFADPDGAGHKYGWGSPEQIKSLEEADAALALVMRALQEAKLLESTTVIVTSDHGGHEKTHGSTLLDDMQVPWIAFGKGVRPGSQIRGRVSTCDTAATALWLLGVPLPESMDGRPVKAAFTYR